MKNQLKIQLKAIIRKANRALRVADEHYQRNDYDFASSKAYYAVFYLMEAILLTKNLTFSKHSAVISAFNRYFIKEGIFPKEFGKMIGNLFRERQIGDYGYVNSPSKAEAEKDLEDAEEISKAIKFFLKKLL